MRIGGKEVVVLADFMRVFVGEKMEASAHPELPSPPPIVAPDLLDLCQEAEALSRKALQKATVTAREEPSEAS